MASAGEYEVTASKNALEKAWENFFKPQLQKLRASRVESTPKKKARKETKHARSTESP